ncbi:hypothetical protein KDH_79990 [Dictyobacter sp. S3.2.2.5]|uniref:Uncharacterized protein n=1 Tax=Dictyobacter halimunensis TaxID=3026934 RepID=A0ABQ6G585_9CHLR|nr:hypothetical protein KDH_79990 [Dictyobacter sp. S3.2.2.5]
MLQSARLLAARCDTAEAEARFLRARNTMLEDEAHTLRSLLADKEAEIVRLTVLLEGQSKRRT